MAAIWGPKIWVLFHRLSFFSNRQDVVGAWRNVLKTLNEVLPCALCRRHMKDYMVKNPLDIPVDSSSAVIRDTIVLWLYNFHNHVNLETGRDPFPFDLMEVQYGYGTHNIAAIEAKRTIADIDAVWAGVPAREWRLAILYLCGLIGGGPM